MSNGLACVDCAVFFVPLKTGAYIEEGFPLTEDNNGPWGSYKLWVCDIAVCPKCGTRVATGFPRRPVAEHFQDDYKEKLKLYPPVTRIDACIGYKP
jgi:hypothetical protein